MSAEERRQAVIRAAISEFALGGYAGTATAAIADRVGVSQPYLFRLFPDKRAIFLAAARRCTDEIRQRFAEVSEGLGPEEARAAMADAYTRLAADREKLVFQMQMYVATATADESGDAEFAAQIRTAWVELWDLVQERLGGLDETGDFMSRGMLINVLLSMGFPPDHRVWAVFDPARKRPQQDE
jgi:AcrR family transcriptional regulator